jgi:hypothetical protein
LKIARWFSLSLLGCRAVIGIDDLGLAGDGGAVDAPLSKPDTRDSEVSATDAGHDSSTADVVVDTGTPATREECLNACAQQFPMGAGELLRPGGGPPCYCIAPCRSACTGATACGNPPIPPNTPGACFTCVLVSAAKGPECMENRTTCAGNAECAKFKTCADRCP